MPLKRTKASRAAGPGRKNLQMPYKTNVAKKATAKPQATTPAYGSKAKRVRGETGGTKIVKPKTGIQVGPVKPKPTPNRPVRPGQNADKPTLRPGKRKPPARPMPTGPKLSFAEWQKTKEGGQVRTADMVKGPNGTMISRHRQAYNRYAGIGGRGKMSAGTGRRITK